MAARTLAGAIALLSTLTLLPTSSAVLAGGPLGVASAVPPAGSDLADAAMRSDVEEARRILDAGGDVDAPQGDGMTALHWAARRGNVELARLLIEAGASLGATTRVGEHTPLHVAARAGTSDIARLLTEAGAPVDAKTTTGVTPLHLAAASGDDEAVSALLEHGASVDPREPRWGQTPLMFAAASGRVAVLDTLMRAGADAAVTARVIDINERSSIDQAERRQRRKRIAELRQSQRGDAEAATSAADAGTAAGPEPTPEEAERRRREREEANERGGEPVPLNYAGLVGKQGGLTALLLAAREGQTESVVKLLDAGAAIDQPSAGDGTSPLLIAVINGHFDLAGLLLDRGADPELANEAGAAPLYAALNTHWAPKSRHPQPVNHQQQQTTYLELMERLLEAGVDVNHRLEKTLWFTTYNRDLLGVNRAGATAFWRAAHALDLTAMKLLLRYGADPDIPTIKVPERRRGPRGEDQSGLPPIPLGGPAVQAIHAASGVGHGQGFAGNSHRHVPDGWLPAVRFLVEELGADVNARDHNGYTPLHHAAARGDNELIRYLVEKGADVTAIARSGQTTADMANGPVQRLSPFPETVALLESLGSANNHNCVGC